MKTKPGEHVGEPKLNDCNEYLRLYEVTFKRSRNFITNIRPVETVEVFFLWEVNMKKS